jgi:2-iminobutanoate/2-iminopropanoate deaminase
MTLQDLVKVNVHLKFANDFDAMNAVYRTYFPVDPPARATQQATIAKDAIMEIEAIAYKA